MASTITFSQKCRLCNFGRGLAADKRLESRHKSFSLDASSGPALSLISATQQGVLKKIEFSKRESTGSCFAPERSTHTLRFHRSVLQPLPAQVLANAAKVPVGRLNVASGPDTTSVRAPPQLSAVLADSPKPVVDSDASSKKAFVPADRKFVTKPPPIWKRVPESEEASERDSGDPSLTAEKVSDNRSQSAAERLSSAERRAARRAEKSTRGEGFASSQTASSSLSEKDSASKESNEVTHGSVKENAASKRGGEASTSGSSHRNSTPTVGTLSSDRPLPSSRVSSDRALSSDRVHSIHKIDRWERQPVGGRIKRPRDPPQERKPQTFEPIVKEVGGLLRRLGRELRIESAVQETVPQELLDRMRSEDWNETLKLLGKTSSCLQMQAVLAYLESSERHEPNEASYARVFFGLHRNNHLESAMDIFNAMRASKFPPTTSMYNAAMSTLVKQGCEMPLIEELFEEMLQRNIGRDKITYSIMMDAVWRSGTRTIRGKKDSRLRDATPKDKRDAATRVEALYEQMLSEGLTPDTIVKNTVLYALVGSGAYKRAEDLFRKMQADQRTPPNDRSYTMMMHMYSERNQQEKLQEVFREMIAAGIPPTDITYNVRIKACQGTKDVREAIRLFREMSEKRLHVSNITYNSLVEVLASAGYFAQAEQIIYGMEVKGIELSPEPYNMLITGLIRAKDCYCDEAMRIFRAMQLARVKPWALTFGALMEGFGKAGRLEEMEQIYRMMRYAKLQPTTTIFTAMIHAYVRADDLETAWDLFIKMRDIGLVPNVQTYTVLIKGFAARGELDMIDELFAEAKEELTEVDAVIYETVILAHVAANSLAAVDSLCKEMEDADVQMLPHTYDKLASMHATAGRHGMADEVMQRKRAAYPELDEQRRAISYGWLKHGYDSDGEEAERPLVLDDIWQVLENPDMSIESRPPVPLLMDKRDV